MPNWLAWFLTGGAVVLIVGYVMLIATLGDIKW